MQSATWVELFRRVPPALHDNLVLMTVSGQELCMQDLVRLEEDYVVLRGRPGGTTDAGRVFFVPYAQINCLGFLKPVGDADLAAMFGGPVPPPAPPAEAPKPGEAEAPPETPAPAPPPPEPAPARPPKPSLESKSVLLQRVRARLAAQAKGSPPAKAPPAEK